MFGLFKCNYCEKTVEKIKRDGLKTKACSHKCYALNREKRGAYKDEDTLNNKIDNLILMSVSEHNKHHTYKRNRSENGKFKI